MEKVAPHQHKQQANPTHATSNNTTFPQLSAATEHTTHHYSTIIRNKQPKQVYNPPLAEKSTSTSTNQEIPASIPVKSDIGKCGLMWPRGIATKHPAAKLLDYYSTQGCPVNIGDNWTYEHIITAIKRGPHISAKKPQAAAHLQMETLQKIRDGYAKIVKWKEIKNNIPPNLKISPVAMIPHKSRMYRTIIDLSFQLRVKGKVLPSVNSATESLAPQKAMTQLGMALRRIINNLATHHNTNKPFLFSKVDLKDGFWRMVVSDKDAWNFCYVLPSTGKNKTNLDETEIVVPHALQMGWAESPPFFCAATETARDVCEQLALTTNNLPTHPLQTQLMPSRNTLASLQQQNPRHKSSTPVDSTQDCTQLEVYVDDFVAMTNNVQEEHLLHWSKAILHGIHSIFPPPTVSLHTGGDPISEKKLAQKEGLWHHEKRNLRMDIQWKRLHFKTT